MTYQTFNRILYSTDDDYTVKFSHVNPTRSTLFFNKFDLLPNSEFIKNGNVVIKKNGITVFDSETRPDKPLQKFSQFPVRDKIIKLERDEQFQILIKSKDDKKVGLSISIEMDHSDESVSSVLIPNTELTQLEKIEDAIEQQEKNVNVTVDQDEAEELEPQLIKIQQLLTELKLQEKTHLTALEEALLKLQERFDVTTLTKALKSFDDGFTTDEITKALVEVEKAIKNAKNPDVVSELHKLEDAIEKLRDTSINTPITRWLKNVNEWIRNNPDNPKVDDVKRFVDKVYPLTREQSLEELIAIKTKLTALSLPIKKTIGYYMDDLFLIIETYITQLRVIDSVNNLEISSGKKLDKINDTEEKRLGEVVAKIDTLTATEREKLDAVKKAIDGLADGFDSAELKTAIEKIEEAIKVTDNQDVVDALKTVKEEIEGLPSHLNEPTSEKVTVFPYKQYNNVTLSKDFDIGQFRNVIMVFTVDRFDFRILSDRLTEHESYRPGIHLVSVPFSESTYIHTFPTPYLRFFGNHHFGRKTKTLTREIIIDFNSNTTRSLDFKWNDKITSHDTQYESPIKRTHGAPKTGHGLRYNQSGHFTYLMRIMKVHQKIHQEITIIESESSNFHRNDVLVNRGHIERLVISKRFLKIEIETAITFTQAITTATKYGYVNSLYMERRGRIKNPDMTIHELRQSGSNNLGEKADIEFMLEGENNVNVPLIPKDVIGEIRDSQTVVLGRDVGNFVFPSSGMSIELNIPNRLYFGMSLYRVA